MTARFLATACAFAAVAALLDPFPARADAIDGDWCSADGARMMSIRGPAIVIPSGRQVQGNYTRHYFSYRVPAGEAKAGNTVSMALLNEDTVRLSDAADGQAAPPPAPGEIWHRCRLPTS